jgi:hypothetical protein
VQGRCLAAAGGGSDPDMSPRSRSERVNETAPPVVTGLLRKRRRSLWRAANPLTAGRSIRQGVVGCNCRERHQYSLNIPEMGSSLSRSSPSSLTAFDAMDASLPVN